MEDGRLDRAALARLRQDLARYLSVLPSLEMKRRQLTDEVGEARRRLAALDLERQRALDHAARRVPMAAGLESLPSLRVTSVRLVHESRYGLSLPGVEDVAVSREGAPGFLSSPVWTDEWFEHARGLAILGVQEQVERIRLHRLEGALVETVRRVHLFERVLIPQAQSRIRRIVVDISDAGRDALVRARHAKRHGRAGRTA